MENAGLSAQEVRRRTGATRQALRLYEERGLLTTPGRTYAGRRRYSPRAVDEVRLIRTGVACGLWLEDMKPALLAWKRGQSALPTLSGVLRKRTAEVETRIQVLTRQLRCLNAMSN